MYFQKTPPGVGGGGGGGAVGKAKTTPATVFPVDISLISKDPYIPSLTADGKL